MTFQAYIWAAIEMVAARWMEQNAVRIGVIIFINKRQLRCTVTDSTVHHEGELVELFWWGSLRPTRIKLSKQSTPPSVGN